MIILRKMTKYGDLKGSQVFLVNLLRFIIIFHNHDKGILNFWISNSSKNCVPADGLSSRYPVSKQQV